MNLFIIGLICGTVGVTLVSGLSEIISTFAEFIKAILSVKIVECNVKINKLNRSTEETHTKVIGFRTTFEEEEENE